MESTDLERDGLVAIDRAACERLLEAGGVGLIALLGDEAPELRPVNFMLHAGRLVLRTGRGRIFEGAGRREPASFAIISADRFEHSGWSVFVQGRLEICGPDDEALRAAVRPWARAVKDEVVALSIEHVSGRRLAERAAP